MFIERLDSQKKISIYDAVSRAKRIKEPVCASEGPYNDRNTLTMIFEFIVYCLAGRFPKTSTVITPVKLLTQTQKEAYHLWKNPGDRSSEGDDPKLWRAFDKIQWKLTAKWKNRIDKIDYPTYYEN